MIVTFDDKVTPIWKIPFPAVTICPRIKFQAEMFDMAYVWKNINKTKSLKETNLTTDVPSDYWISSDLLGKKQFKLMK